MCINMSYDYLCLFADLFFNVLQQSTVDKLLKDTNLALVVGTHSWREQFIDAVTVSAGQLLCVCYIMFVISWFHHDVITLKDDKLSYWIIARP